MCLAYFINCTIWVRDQTSIFLVMKIIWINEQKSKYLQNVHTVLHRTYYIMYYLYLLFLLTKRSCRNWTIYQVNLLFTNLSADRSNFGVRLNKFYINIPFTHIKCSITSNVCTSHTHDIKIVVPCVYKSIFCCCEQIQFELNFLSLLRCKPLHKNVF